MKKVLVLAAAVALFAAPALADVVGSKHDLSAQNGQGTTVTAGTSSQVCVYCHTPHGAKIDAGSAPLWNRTNLATYAGAVYGGWDLGAAAGAVNAAAVDATDARLCFSCHAGDNLTNALQNAPNGGTISTFAPVGFATGNSPMNIGDAANGVSDDHPIGFNYSAAAAEAGSELVAVPAAAYFPATGIMWCSSCHDVHTTGPDANVEFLRVTMAGSALCLDCHVK